MGQSGADRRPTLSDYQPLHRSNMVRATPEGRREGGRETEEGRERERERERGKGGGKRRYIGRRERNIRGRCTRVFKILHCVLESSLLSTYFMEIEEAFRFAPFPDVS